MRLIDADALKEELAKRTPHFARRIEFTPCFKAIRDAPTVDAVPVVRCDECRWYDKSTASGTYEPIAYKCILHQRFTIGIQFCSDGEREDDAADKR